MFRKLMPWRRGSWRRKRSSREGDVELLVKSSDPISREIVASASPQEDRVALQVEPGVDVLEPEQGDGVLRETRYTFTCPDIIRISFRSRERTSSPPQLPEGEK